MEMNEKIPQLTLTPELDSQPVFETKPDTAIAQTPEADTRPEAGPEMAQLSEAEQKAVLEFAEKIDITDTGLVLQYGAGAQKNISDFSGKALNNVRTKDMGEVGEMLSDLVMELKGFDAEEERKGLRGLFRKANSGMEMMKVKYDKAEANVEKVSRQLEGHKITLLGDIARLDQMYEQNLEYYKQLTMYILAGQKALKKAKEVTLPQMRAEAAASALPSDAQKVNDYANMCDRFEKRLHDLELTRVICLQMAPQIRMIQNNDTVMVEKIQTTLMNTIPLWKNQMVLALGIAHSTEAAEAQRQVNDVTNELLRRNAERLHLASVETAKEAERGIVDIETLKQTNAKLIQTFDDVMKIQADGRAKRLAAEAEMVKMENDLKQKLLQIRNGN